MSKIKEFYHEEICQESFNYQEFLDSLDNRYYFDEIAIHNEDAQIMKRAEEMFHSEMPNFLR